MAFIKELLLENGISGSYWKIIKTEVDFLENTAEIWFGHLLNKQLNDEKYNKGFNNADLLLSRPRRIQFTPENFPFTKVALEGSDIKAIAYNASKQADEFFTDAVDDK